MSDALDFLYAEFERHMDELATHMRDALHRAHNNAPQMARLRVDDGYVALESVKSLMVLIENDLRALEDDSLSSGISLQTAVDEVKDARADFCGEDSDT